MGRPALPQTEAYLIACVRRQTTGESHIAYFTRLSVPLALHRLTLVQRAHNAAHPEAALTLTPIGITPIHSGCRKALEELGVALLEAIEIEDLSML